MSDVKDWDINAGANNDPAPNGFPEGMPPSGVNDSAREVMASIKRFYELIGTEYDVMGVPFYGIDNIKPLAILNGMIADATIDAAKLNFSVGGTVNWYAYYSTGVYTPVVGATRIEYQVLGGGGGGGGCTGGSRICASEGGGAGGYGMGFVAITSQTPFVATVGGGAGGGGAGGTGGLGGTSSLVGPALNAVAGGGNGGKGAANGFYKVNTAVEGGVYGGIASGCNIINTRGGSSGGTGWSGGQLESVSTSGDSFWGGGMPSRPTTGHGAGSQGAGGGACHATTASLGGGAGGGGVIIIKEFVG